jgi:imidazolonepropionase-like amidohydrolase
LLQEVATYSNALRADEVTPLGTIEPARAFGLTDTVDAIAAGQAADLLVLDADPLADINNTEFLPLRE